LSWTVQAVAIDDARVEHADIASPERVMDAVAGTAQQLNCLAGRDGAGVAGLADDTHETVLCDGTGRPPGCNLLIEPPGGPVMVNVVAVEEREQHVYIE